MSKIKVFEWVKVTDLPKEFFNGLSRFDINCGMINIDDYIKYDQVHYDSLYKSWHDSHQRSISADHLFILQPSTP